LSNLRGKAGQLLKTPYSQLLLLIVTGLLSLVALVMPISIRPSEYSIRVGEVAQEDIQAPRTMSYVSDVLSEQARLEAEHNVAPIYNAADPAIARKQIEKLRISLNYISSVRADSFASYQNKISDLKAVKDIRVNEDMAKRILALSTERWEIIQGEALGHTFCYSQQPLQRRTD
jgi:membrane-associated HD superfamily phosphohydrolase